MSVTVEQLRREGYKVRVTHVRDTIAQDDDWNWLFSRYEYEEKLKSGKLDFATRPSQVVFSKKYGDVVLPHGGFTHVEVTTPDGQTVSAKYNFPRKKPFVRKEGTKIALFRALGKLNS